MAARFEIWTTGVDAKSRGREPLPRDISAILPAVSADEIARLCSGGVRLAAVADSDDEARRLAWALTDAGIPARVVARQDDAAPDPAADPPMMDALGAPLQRIVLGILVCIMGTLIIQQSLLVGAPVCVVGAWLLIGRSLSQLSHDASTRLSYLLGWGSGLLFFFAGIAQASHTLVPSVPLFAISLLLLPPSREGLYSLTRVRLPAGARETLIVLSLMAYGALLSGAQQDAAMQAKQERWTRIVSDGTLKARKAAARPRVSKPETVEELRSLLTRHRFQEADALAQKHFSAAGHDADIMRLWHQAKAGALRQKIGATSPHAHAVRAELYAELSRYAQDQDYWAMYEEEARKAREAGPQR